MIIAYILDNCYYSAEAEKLIKQHFKKHKFIRNYTKNEQLLLGGHDDLVKYLTIQNEIKMNHLSNDVLFLLSKYIK